MAAARQGEDHDMHLKLLMLGDTGVGKTCMLQTYVYDTFSPTFITTIGIDFKIKHQEIDGTKLKLQIWDTAGQERFRTITVSYFKGAHGIVLMYDVTDRETFDSISHWLMQIKEHADAQVNVVLVGNKCDIADKRQVEAAEGQALADEYKLKFFETSAKANTRVDETFTSIASETRERLMKQESEGTSGIKLNMAPENKPKKKCC
mmetsp:Transcript_37225/g.85915  ORF Transcript_37225/g.85915 Transcript_37225/m.85915 type:complete len:205 (+) Transcript_37225:225-839(+)